MARQPPGDRRAPRGATGPDPDATQEFVAVPESVPLAQSPPAPARKPSGTHKISVLGDFRLLAKLGAGGMGTVYRARQLSQARDVALKVLSKDLAARPDFLARFQREGRLMAR